MIRTIDDALRGRGDELGLVAWVMVLRRTWITLVALLSAAIGYVVNDVVHSIGADLEFRPTPATSLAPRSDAG